MYERSILIGEDDTLYKPALFKLQKPFGKLIVTDPLIQL